MNKAELTDAFRRIGLQEGMILEVHSSLRSFGHVEGGADTVIDALMTCVGPEGSIFMPALRLSPPLPLTEDDRRLGITSKIRVLPEDAPHTAMGLIADVFRLRPDVITGKGIIRTAGWGLHAQEAAIGGLDYAIHHGGKALLLGVDIYKLTAMHYMEDILPQAVRDLFAPSAQASAQYPPEEWFIEAGEPPVRAWYAIQEEALQLGLIQQGQIGTCHTMLFDIMDVVSLYRRALETRPLQLYGLL